MSELPSDLLMLSYLSFCWMFTNQCESIRPVLLLTTYRQMCHGDVDAIRMGMRNVIIYN